MKYSKLGNTDLEVSKICLGTMTFGEQNSEADAHEQLNYAIEQGVNFIDTAELYAVPSTEQNSGLTEKYIGSWLKDRSDRDKIIIATKVAGPSTGLKYISENLGFSKERILEAVDGSLKRLQTDYIDLYQLHWPERRSNMFGVMNYKHWSEWEDNFLDILQTMKELVDAGKIRHFGISNETPWGLNNFLKKAEQHNLPRCMSVQNPYSLLNRTYEIGLAEISIREKAGLLAYSPMAFGLLSGKYHKKTDTAASRLNKFKNMARYSSQNCYDATAKYLEIAEKYDLSLAQMSLAFINQQLFTTSNIIGATTMKQLKENIASIDIELSADVLKEIDAVHREFPNPAP